MDTNYKNQHEPTFNRELVVGERGAGAKMSSVHARVHSVFGSIISAQKPVVTQKPAARPTNAVSRTVVTPHHAAIARPAARPIAKMTAPQNSRTRHYLDIMPAHAAIHPAARVTFQPVRSIHPAAKVQPVQHVGTTAPKIAKIATAPKIASKVVAAPKKEKVTDLSKPLTLAEALANIETTTNYDLFVPNAVNPAAAKMAEKESLFDKMKKFAKKGKKPAKSASLHEKVAAHKEINAKRKAAKSAALAKRRETRAHLLRDNEMNAEFANNLMAAAETSAEPTLANKAMPVLRADTNNNFAKSTSQKRSPAISFGGGAIAIDTSALRNPFANLNAAHISFVMPKINARKVLSVLRVTAVLVILTVSGYLAWDTWASGHSAQTFNATASAMSIASVNPSTADPTAVSSQQYSAYTTPADEPRYISIPSINVNARVQKVCVTSSGNIDVAKKWPIPRGMTAALNRDNKAKFSLTVKPVLAARPRRHSMICLNSRWAAKLLSKPAMAQFIITRL